MSNQKFYACLRSFCGRLIVCTSTECPFFVLEPACSKSSESTVAHKCKTIVLFKTNGSFQNNVYLFETLCSFFKTDYTLFKRNVSFQNKCFISKQMFHFKTNVSFQNKCFISKQMFHFKTNVSLQNKWFFSKQCLSFRNTLLFLQNKLHSFQKKCFFSKQMFHFKTNVSFQNKCFISKQMFHFKTNVSFQNKCLVFKTNVSSFIMSLTRRAKRFLPLS